MNLLIVSWDMSPRARPLSTTQYYSLLPFAQAISAKLHPSLSFTGKLHASLALTALRQLKASSCRMVSCPGSQIQNFTKHLRHLTCLFLLGKPLAQELENLYISNPSDRRRGLHVLPLEGPSPPGMSKHRNHSSSYPVCPDFFLV